MKATIGKASKGFDFLGKRILPIGVLPSASALSRMQRNTERLYEQGASKKRIVRYWMKWLGWAAPMALFFPHVALALSVGMTCASVTDTDDRINAGAGTTGVGYISMRKGPPRTCHTDSEAYITDGDTSASPFSPLELNLNTFTDSTTQAYEGLRVLHHTTVSNLRVNGVVITASSHVLALTTAAAYTGVFTFTYDGVDLQFTITKAAGTNTLGAFTVEAQTPVDTSTASHPGVFGGELVTPTSYQVTINKIEFKNAEGEYVTLAEEGSRFDVASVSRNSPVGTFGKTAGIPNGVYSEIRVTLARSFGMTFSGTDKNKTCRTDSAGATGSPSTSLTNMPTGSSDGGTATLQEITFPSNTVASSKLAAAGVTESGNALQISAPLSFTITDNNFPPNLRLNINVADSAEVLTVEGQCYVVPQPPSISASVGG